MDFKWGSLVQLQQAIHDFFAGKMTADKLAAVLHEMSDRLNEQERQSICAVLEKELRKTYDMAAGLFYDAECLYNKGEMEAALAKIRQALGLNSAEVRGWLLQAKIADKLLDTELVYNSLTKAVSLEAFKQLPNKIQLTVLLSLANLYGNTNKIGELLKLQRYAATLPESMEEQRLLFSTYLYVMQTAALGTAEEMLAENQKYNTFFSAIRSFQHEKRFTQGRKIRIGYLSVDYCQHPVAFFMMKLLYFHNKNEFEIYCYSGTREQDNATQQIQSLCDVWRDITNLEAKQAARCIYDDCIDILFDLGGHTVHNLLSIMAYRPAPIQISGIGYIGTTGMKAVDYFLTDCYCDTREGVKDFSEKLLVLPHSHFCYTMRDDLKPLQPAPYIKNGYVTFGSFNRVEKITDEILSVWSKILQRVENSRLLLKSSFAENSYFKKVMQKRLIKAGIDLKRVIMQGATVNYMEEYLAVDIALDTFPCCGGTTTCDALVMGVPVITRVGERHVSRFGYSIMKNAGLEEFIAFDWQEYIERAAVLAHDKARLNAYHLMLREKLRTSPVMDGALYAQNIESAYKRILDAYNCNFSIQ